MMTLRVEIWHAFILLFKMYVVTFAWWLVDLSAHACEMREAGFYPAKNLK